MKEIVETLIKNNETISTMESCTGGELVTSITNIENSSKVLKYSAVTYSNEYKIKMGISKKTIEDYTVYSEEVAKEMSKQISEYTNSTYGVGITGQLKKEDENNPNNDTDKVYISIYSKKKNEFYTKKITLPYNLREENKKYIVKEIINFLKKILFIN